jgi:hypothetical protein
MDQLHAFQFSPSSLFLALEVSQKTLFVSRKLCCLCVCGEHKISHHLRLACVIFETWDPSQTCFFFPFFNGIKRAKRELGNKNAIPPLILVLHLTCPSFLVCSLPTRLYFFFFYFYFYYGSEGRAGLCLLPLDFAPESSQG